MLTKHKNFVLKFGPQFNFILAQQTIALEQLNMQGDTPTTEIIYNNIFDLLNAQLNLPLTLSTKSWDIELDYNMHFPSAIGTETDLKTTSFFNISIGNLFDLDK